MIYPTNKKWFWNKNLAKTVTGDRKNKEASGTSKYRRSSERIAVLYVFINQNKGNIRLNREENSWQMMALSNNP